MLDFLGIGAQKSGTTWLYEMLRLHPGISFPAGKEVHFWDAQRARGLEWYRSLFPDGSGTKQGEITPAYAMLSPETIREVRDLNPGLRIVYLIRNPIDRAWSSALMALGRAEMTVDEASDQWFVDHFRSRGSLGRGDYERCIRNWSRELGEGALLVLRHEALTQDPRGLLGACCRHIGVDPGPCVELPDQTLARRVFSGGSVPLRPSLRAVLHGLYDERIRRLGDRLGIDLGAWLEG